MADNCDNVGIPCINYCSKYLCEEGSSGSRVDWRCSTHRFLYRDNRDSGGYGTQEFCVIRFHQILLWVEWLVEPVGSVVPWFVN